MSYLVREDPKNQIEETKKKIYKFEQNYEDTASKNTNIRDNSSRILADEDLNEEYEAASHEIYNEYAAYFLNKADKSNDLEMSL